MRTVFLFLLSSFVYSQADTLVDSIQPMNEKLVFPADSIFFFGDCAHGHICCRSMCNCCPELRRKQLLDTFPIYVTDDHSMEAVIERYAMAANHEKSPLQYVLKTSSGEIVRKYFAEVAENDLFFPAESDYNQIEILDQAKFAFDDGQTVVFNEKGEYLVIDRLGNELSIEYTSNVPITPYLRRVSLLTPTGRRVFGLVDRENNKVSGLKYRSIKQMSNGYFRVQDFHNGRYTVLNESGERITSEDFLYIGDFSNGSCPVKPTNYQWALIRNTGETVPTEDYDSILDESEGLFMVEQNDKYGFIDSLGNELIPVVYPKLKPFSQGLAAVFQGHNGSKWGYIDKKNELVIPYQFHDAKSFSEGKAVVMVEENVQNRKWGVIDSKGDFLLEPTYDELWSFKDGVAQAYMDREGSGFINDKFREIVPFKYHLHWNMLADNWFLDDKVLVSEVGEKNSYQLIDKKGRTRLELFTIEHALLLDLTEENRLPLLQLKKNEKWGVVSFDGKRIIPFKYRNIMLADNKYVIAMEENSFTVYNLRGEMIISSVEGSFIGITDEVITLNLADQIIHKSLRGETIESP